MAAGHGQQQGGGPWVGSRISRIEQEERDEQPQLGRGKKRGPEVMTRGLAMA